MQKDWKQTGNDRGKWPEDMVTDFTYDPDDGFTFDMWFRKYELLFEREGKSLADGEKVEILLLKLGRMEHEKYVKFVLPKKPAEIEFTETQAHSSEAGAFRASEARFSRGTRTRVPGGVEVGSSSSCCDSAIVLSDVRLSSSLGALNNRPVQCKYHCSHRR
ncbi:hypothetical protein SprV_0602107300 [Sparganum proliferum]